MKGLHRTKIDDKIMEILRDWDDTRDGFQVVCSLLDWVRAIPDPKPTGEIAELLEEVAEMPQCCSSTTDRVGFTRLIRTLRTAITALEKERDKLVEKRDLLRNLLGRYVKGDIDDAVFMHTSMRTDLQNDVERVQKERDTLQASLDEYRRVLGELVKWQPALQMVGFHTPEKLQNWTMVYDEARVLLRMRQRRADALEEKCRYCNGRGERFLKTSDYGIYSMGECPQCHGSGWATPEEVDDASSGN